MPCCLAGLSTSQFVQGKTAAAHQTAARTLALAEPDSELSGPAHFAFAGSAVSLGRPAEAARHFALAAVHGGAFSLSVGIGPDVHGRAFAAHPHWLLGHAEQALSSCNEAIALARTTGNPYSSRFRSPMARSLTSCAMTAPPSTRPSQNCTSCAIGTASPTTASGR